MLLSPERKSKGNAKAKAKGKAKGKGQKGAAHTNARPLLTA